MTINTTIAGAIDIQQSKNTEASVDKQQSLDYCAKCKFRDAIIELVNVIKIVTCNHKKKRILKFEEREKAIRKDLLEIESKNPDDQVLLSLKDKEFKLSDIPFSCSNDNHLVQEYHQLTQTSTLTRDPKITEEERGIKDRDSLFHNRPDLKDHRLELLEIGHDIDKAIKNNPSRFVINNNGSTYPVFDKECKVIFKRRKNASMGVFSYMLRKKIEELGLDSIVLPTREIWKERKVKSLQNGKIKTSAVCIENIEKNVFPYIQALHIYRDKSECIIKALEQFIILSCYYEVGDMYLSNDRIKSYIDFYSTDGRDLEGWFSPEYRCNFDNLLIQKVKDKEGNDLYKFVLADIDVIRYPDKTTVNNLIALFPDHEDLIIKLVSKHNPSLLEDRSEETRVDWVPSNVSLFDKEQLIHSYKKNPLFNKKYDKYLQDIKIEELDCDGKLAHYEKLINMKKITENGEVIKVSESK